MVAQVCATENVGLGRLVIKAHMFASKQPHFILCSPFLNHMINLPYITYLFYETTSQGLAHIFIKSACIADPS
jgi:hypothetical protein